MKPSTPTSRKTIETTSAAVRTEDRTAAASLVVDLVTMRLSFRPGDRLDAPGADGQTTNRNCCRRATIGWCLLFGVLSSRWERAWPGPPMMICTPDPAPFARRRNRHRPNGWAFEFPGQRLPPG